MTLVDTCVLLDVVGNDPAWADWSQARLEHAASHGGILINPVISAEFSVGFENITRVEQTLAGFSARMQAVPRKALFLAGKAFRQYRARGGTRASVLPDFFIGAHAAVQELAVLTRDVRRMRQYFPTLALISPEASP